jgi:hypothetical protein
MADRFARYGAASGIVAVILIFVGFGIYSSGIPDIDASGEEWGSFFADNQGQVHFGLTLAGIGLFFFLWFLGSLRSAIAAAEPGAARLASIALAGGIIGTGVLGIGAAASLTAAFRPDELDPGVTRALVDFGAIVGAPGAAGFTALFAATAIAGYRHGALPAPIAGFSALAAITQPLTYGVGVTDSGAFAADGFLGLWIPVITFAIAVLTASVTLTRTPGRAVG